MPLIVGLIVCEAGQAVCVTLDIKRTRWTTGAMGIQMHISPMTARPFRCAAVYSNGLIMTKQRIKWCNNC